MAWATPAVAVATTRRAAVAGLATALLAACPPPAAAAVPPPPGFADLVEAVAPAVVRIETLEHAAAAPATDGAIRPPPRAGAGAPRRAPAASPGTASAAPPSRRLLGAGSGFLVDPDGTIVTNHHVAGEAQRVTVTLADGTELPARLIGSDPVTDIAVLKVDPPPGSPPLPALRFAEGPPPRAGDWALVVGNPFGVGASVSLGLVSARGRDIAGSGWGDLIQTDAAINPGSSGGPLFDAQGRVAGVTSAIVTPSGGSVGVGFAVPAAVAAPVVAALRAHGRLERGFLGVDAQPMTPELARALGGAPPRGALLDAVAPRGPAERGGLRPGDVVTALDDAPVEGPAPLARGVGLLGPGAPARLALWRAGRELSAVVVLGAAPTPPPPAPASAAPEHRGYGLSLAPAGARGGGARPEPGGGAVVARVLPGGAAEAAGLRPGDVILAVGGAAVRGPEEAIAALRAAAGAGPAGAARQEWVALRVRRGDAAVFVALATPH